MTIRVDKYHEYEHFVRKFWLEAGAEERSAIFSVAPCATEKIDSLVILSVVSESEVENANEPAEES